MVEHRQTSKEAIAFRAHELYVERGCEDGRGVEDWLKAERELSGNPVEARTSPGVLSSSQKTRIRAKSQAGSMKFNQRSTDDGRRRFRRVPSRLRVRIDSETDHLEAEAIDASLNGILVRTSRILPLGSPVEVGLYLPSETKAVVASGTVVRVYGSHQMAIQIDRMLNDESRRLEEHLLSLITSVP